MVPQILRQVVKRPLIFSPVNRGNNVGRMKMRCQLYKVSRFDRTSTLNQTFSYVIFFEYFAIILSYFYDFVSNCISNLCSLSSAVYPLGPPPNKCSTNEPIVDLLNLLQTDYVGNQEHIFFSKCSCQKIIFLKHSSGLGDWNLAHFLTQFCVIIS